jgi:hypothetical protein
MPSVGRQKPEAQHLLEGHHVGERLEQRGKPGRPHATKRRRRGAEPRLGLGEELNRLRIDVETEDRTHDLCECSARHRGWIGVSQ